MVAIGSFLLMARRDRRPPVLPGLCLRVRPAPRPGRARRVGALLVTVPWCRPRLARLKLRLEANAAGATVRGDADCHVATRKRRLSDVKLVERCDFRIPCLPRAHLDAIA